VRPSNVWVVGDTCRPDSRAVDGSLVSVVMPAHDEEHTIGGAIESILQQGVDGLEIIVVTDRCSDQTAHVAAAYPGVRVVACEGAGLVDALNTGIRQSREIIVRLDADDRHHLHAVGRPVGPMLANPALAVVGGGTREVTQDGELIEVVAPAADERHAAFILMITPAFGHSAVAFRRDVVVANGGYRGGPTIHAEDYDLWSRLVAAGVAMRGIDVVVADRVVTKESVSARPWEEQAASSRRVSDRAIELWGLHDRPFRRIVALGREVGGRQRQRLQVICVRLARRCLSRRAVVPMVALTGAGLALRPRSMISGTLAMRRNAARYREIWDVQRLKRTT
jgi:glycosyltransferase involved in cell wall biosynthesis